MLLWVAGSGEHWCWFACNRSPAMLRGLRHLCRLRCCAVCLLLRCHGRKGLLQLVVTALLCLLQSCRWKCGCSNHRLASPASCHRTPAALTHALLHTRHCRGASTLDTKAAGWDIAGSISQTVETIIAREGAQKDWTAGSTPISAPMTLAIRHGGWGEGEAGSKGGGQKGDWEGLGR